MAVHLPHSAPATRSIIASVLAAGAALAGCGGGSSSDDSKAQAASKTPSKQEQAQAQVCTARADIQKQVDALSTMTSGTVTVDGVKSSLKSIGDDVKTITTAQDDLSGERKQQLQQGVSAFKTSVEQVGRTLLKSLSVDDAKTQLQVATDQLATSFKQSLEPIDCSG
jgi:hypothetical protein